ncbi:MAG: bifunctional nuclease family protein [Planctomycetes bacterium]|nr:bifunctional nuclease family protein [Planctomycetota bacterium]
MELSRIVIAETAEEQVIVLKEVEGNRSFPIVIGIFEASAIDRKVKNIKTPRPLTHDLLESVVRSMGAELKKIVVTNLKHGTFYAKLVLSQNGGMVEVDSRPSDAIALATQMSAPIFVEEEVLNEVLAS